MVIRRRPIFVILLLAGIIGTGSFSALADGMPISETSGLQRTPRTDGEIAVWSTLPPGEAFADIYGVDLATGAQFPIEVDPEVNAVDPAIDGSFVIWAQSIGCIACPREIFGMNLDTGETFRVSESRGGLPAISGSLAVWNGGDETEPKIMARDLATDDPPFIVAVGRSSLWPPSIDGNRMVWGDVVPLESDPSVNGWRLFTIEIGDEEPTLIAEGRASIGIGNSWGWGLAGDLVVYVDNDLDIIAQAVSGDELARIPGEGRFNRQPTTDGRYIVWMREPLVGEGFDLWGYDLQTESLFQITANPYWVQDPDLQDGVLVWARGQSGSADAVYAAWMVDLLPSAPAAAPGAGQPYFPETGHTLSSSFSNFWNTNGALPVFGFPLTESFEERNPDTSELQRTQFTERQRFELHSALVGTPYEVLLGRLGADLLDAQGRDWHAFPKADPDAPHYFPVTGHAIASEFWDYWSSHGLDLGDDGVSFRESLALFGFPLSEPMVETNADGDTVLTQYFERAVYEYHPDNPTPYQVLLRRLGAEMLAFRGW